jgi:hypothetical protein
MAKPQTYRDVDVPDGFESWDINARVNYLAGAMDRTQIADHLREITGQDPREEPTFKKDELVEIIISVQEGSANGE